MHITMDRKPDYYILFFLKMGYKNVIFSLSNQNIQVSI